MVAGGIIGLERAFRGRAAGFRTHALVCTSSSLLMLFTVFQWDLLGGIPLETIRIDPTRMAQGIMTGIGFLGAGVIMKDKYSIRGLTTAASIWITASIGIVIGMGFYLAAGFGTFLTLIILSFFGWFERKLPTMRYGRLVLKFKRNAMMSKNNIYKMIENYNIKGYNPSYYLTDQGESMQYVFTIRTNNTNNYQELIESLCNIDQIIEFRLIPTGE